MPKPTVVKWGWIIQDQAASVPGIHFGPGWLKGRQRSGPVHAGYHNLIGKDIIFHGNGKNALGAIMEQMRKLAPVKVRCGIYPGMTVEKFVESEFGGGMDQVRVEATEADVVRMPYYVYVAPEEKSKYSFNALTLSLVQTATAVGTNIGIQGAEGVINYRELWGKAVDLAQAVGESRHDNRSDLQKAQRADKAFVILTSRTMAGKRPVATHKETKTLSDLARAITSAIQSGK
jgi:hypothetical protein